MTFKLIYFSPPAIDIVTLVSHIVGYHGSVSFDCHSL